MSPSSISLEFDRSKTNSTVSRLFAKHLHLRLRDLEKNILVQVPHARDLVRVKVGDRHRPDQM